MSRIQFANIETAADLADSFGCSVEDLAKLSEAANKLPFYQLIRIPKRGRRRRGQFRTVYKPTDQTLRLLLKNLATALAGCTRFDECVQGFTAKRSIVTNARAHLGARLLLHADIKDFFESIKLPVIEESFQSIGCNSTIASILAGICSLSGPRYGPVGMRTAFLPQGSSASPIIANIASRGLDADLLALAAGTGSTYTRYADDLTFSGDAVPSEAAVKRLLNKHGFELRNGTCRTQKKGKAQYVTGLTVADTNSPRIARRTKRRLRLELFYINKYGLKDHREHGARKCRMSTARRIEGWLRFLHSVEPDRAKALTKMWKERKPDPAINPAEDDAG
jgi:RNA-directed DNA polymerase